MSTILKVGKNLDARAVLFFLKTSERFGYKRVYPDEDDDVAIQFINSNLFSEKEKEEVSELVGGKAGGVKKLHHTFVWWFEGEIE